MDEQIYKELLKNGPEVYSLKDIDKILSENARKYINKTHTLRNYLKQFPKFYIEQKNDEFYVLPDERKLIQEVIGILQGNKLDLSTVVNRLQKSSLAYIKKYYNRVPDFFFYRIDVFVCTQKDTNNYYVSIIQNNPYTQTSKPAPKKEDTKKVEQKKEIKETEKVIMKDPVKDTKKVEQKKETQVKELISSFSKITFGEKFKIEIKNEEIDTLLKILPDKWLKQFPKSEEKRNSIYEVEVELGRKPRLYYFKVQKYEELEEKCTTQDIDYLTKDIKEAKKNRYFIDDTLHRICLTESLDKSICAVTMRFGKPIIGISEIISDLVMEDKSILFLGPPGTGKTSFIRDLARNISAKYKKTFVIDESCEISGNGNHWSLGDSHVVHVPYDTKKEEIMIQVVQNRTPDVMIIDEIGNQQEYNAAKTVSQRGVILYATAHGSILNIEKNDIVMKLLGGISVVTLSDDMALMNDGEKTKLENKTPPLFDIIVEISKEERNTWYIYRDLPKMLRALLSKVKKPIEREVRVYDEKRETWKGKMEDIEF